MIGHSINVDMNAFITKIVKSAVVPFSFSLTVQSVDNRRFNVREYICKHVQLLVIGIRVRHICF